MESQGQAALWNFDGAQLQLIFEIKADFLSRLREWDLDNAYWRLRDLATELDAKLFRNFKELETNKEIKATERMLAELETERNDYSKNPLDKQVASKFYLYLEAYYKYLNRLMKKHGLYFREGEDPRKAILQR